MYVLIEHSGTPEHLQISDNIRDFAENNYGCTCETVVGDNNEINLYTEGLDKFATFASAPKEQDLTWYFNLSLDTEEM